MDFLGNLIFSIVLTAIVYMAFPLIMLAINHGKFEKKRANRIALWNSVVLGVFFCILTIAMDSMSTWNAAPAIFYWWINGLILTDKNHLQNRRLQKLFQRMIKIHLLPALLKYQTLMKHPINKRKC